MAHARELGRLADQRHRLNRHGNCYPGNGPVHVTPATSSYLLVGSVLQLSATPIDQKGTPVAGCQTISRTSSDPAVAVVSGSGLVTAIGPGTEIITATSEGRSTNATVSVTPPRVVAVTVTPDAAIFDLVAARCCETWTNPTVQLSVVARNSAGNAVAGRSVQWSSSDTLVARVSSTGLVTAQE